MKAGDRCRVWWEGIPGGEDTQCPVTETLMYVIGCVHEHVRDIPVCTRHAAEAESGVVMQCRACLESQGGGHHCPVTLVRCAAVPG